VGPCLSIAEEFVEGMEPSSILVCWGAVWKDHEQRSYLRRAQGRLWMAGWEREEE